MYKYTDNGIDAYTYLYPLVLFLFPFVGPCLWNIIFARVFLLLGYTFGVLVVFFSPVGEKNQTNPKVIQANKHGLRLSDYMYIKTARRLSTCMLIIDMSK